MSEPDRLTLSRDLFDPPPVPDPRIAHLSPRCRQIYELVLEAGAIGVTVFEAMAKLGMQNKKDVIAPRFSDLAKKHRLIVKTERKRPPRPGAKPTAHVYVDRRWVR